MQRFQSRGHANTTVRLLRRLNDTAVRPPKPREAHAFKALGSPVKRIVLILHRLPALRAGDRVFEATFNSKGRKGLFRCIRKESPHSVYVTLTQCLARHLTRPAAVKTTPNRLARVLTKLASARAPVASKSEKQGPKRREHHNGQQPQNSVRVISEKKRLEQRSKSILRALPRRVPCQSWPKGKSTGV